MLFRLLFITAFVVAFPNLVEGQTWTSPDGFVKITPPDTSRFQLMPVPPSPFTALWVSDNELTKLGIMESKIPPNIELVQSAVEEGLAEQVGGDVVRLPTKQISGHEVWCMTAKGTITEITQAVVLIDGTVYKLMGVTIAGSSDVDVVNRFIDSLSIEQASSAKPKSSRQRGAQSSQKIGSSFDLHNLSKMIGGAGALLGIGLLVYLLTRGKKGQRA